MNPASIEERIERGRGAIVLARHRGLDTTSREEELILSRHFEKPRK